MVLKCVTGIIKFVNKKCEIRICLFIYHCIVQHLFPRSILYTKLLFFFKQIFSQVCDLGSIARYYFKLESFRKLIKKSHTFPTIAFLRYLKEQWEFCKEVFNTMLMSSELVFCVLVIMRRLPAFWLVSCGHLSCLGILQRPPENKMHSGLGFPFVVIEIRARYLDIINTFKREDLNIPTIFKSCFLKCDTWIAYIWSRVCCSAAICVP